MNVWNELRADLDSLEAAQLLRRPVVVESGCGPRVRVGRRELVCLCSNDYLGLAGEEALKHAAIEAIRQWGVGAGASRLISGTTTLHAALEQALARFKRVGAVAVTSAGWLANAVAVRVLVGPGDLVLADKLSHASLLDAAAASGAALRTWPHADLDRLEKLLDRLRGRHRRCLIATDSLFSMDGDLAPLPELARLKGRYDALLMIDEAHATGVLGAGGRGAAELLNCEQAVDVTVGTLSKALGALGGFVAGPEDLIQTIRNRGREFIYTTALPPAICAAALAALEIVQAQPRRRQAVLALARRLREELIDSGISPGASVSQIVPIMVGPAGAAAELSGRLMEAGFLAPAIRPPTVPRGASRLRVSLCATHQEQDILRLVQVLRAHRDLLPDAAAAGAAVKAAVPPAGEPSGTHHEPI
jgi:8-amino-7-oxononanoate synthase